MNVQSQTISDFTDAPERQRAVIEFSGKSGEEVFEIMGDPDRITDWYILAKQIHHHEPGPDGEARFNVEFTFFGDVHEEVMLWDPPNQYIYKATGDDFPIKDYVARIAVEMTGPRAGRMTWTMHFDVIEGQEFKRILPIILHPINEHSMQKLASLMGGRVVECTMDFSGLEADG
ncbi:SRPBCC family protein [Rhodobacteraceae bacterium nBUS_24]|jgi:hypothetical protein